jgi:endonuclease/exonuclease/phosphatase family metal-dependent hydrolase
MLRLSAIAIGLSLCATCIGAEIRVLTYNIHHGEGVDGIVDLERIASVVLAESPDIVCLQEVDKNLSRTGLIDMPHVLAQLLKMNVAYGPNLFWEKGEYGNATFSRFPIASHENIPLPTPQGIEPRGCLKTKIAVGNATVTVFNTHFGLTERQRKEQASVLLKHIETSAAILAGDLNESSDRPGLSQLLNVYSDSFNRGGPGEQFTSPGGQKRIDFVLASRDWNIVSSRVISTDAARVASDHLPYLAVLSMPGKSERRPFEGDHGDGGDRLNKAITEGSHPWQDRSTGSR